ncbi:MAG: tetratricopeptide repeat protein [Oligoflexia bacterium]|nr:tetratricopeptide repeat protein [Oligoflexia bacterium]
MNQDVSSFVERYQLIYERDPQSKVFAPLAEAYRRMGLIDEAIDLAERGVKRHPHFASGRVALGKCFFQKREYQKALEELKIAADLSPENLLAHQIMADCYLKLKKPTDALNAYKMVLFINPHDARTSEIVRKLEDEVYAEVKPQTWAEEDFSMEKLADVATKANAVGFKNSKNKNDKTQDVALSTSSEGADFERNLALLDTRMNRGDWTTACDHLDQLLELYPQNSELLKRKTHIDELSQNSFDIGEWISPLQSNVKNKKIEKLENLLSTIDSRRKA